MEDLAARYRHGGGSLGGDGAELPHSGRESVVGRPGVSHPHIHRVDHLHDVGERFQWFHDHDRRRRRIHYHDDSGWRIHHDVHRTIDVLHRRCRTSTRPDGPDADARQLDQPDVHDHCCGLEHRLGVQMCPGTCGRTIVPGIRDPGRVITRQDPRNHPDRTIRTIGDGAIHSRSTDVGGAGPRDLYLGGQGHRFVGPRATHNTPKPGPRTGVVNRISRRTLVSLVRWILSSPRRIPHP